MFNGLLRVSLVLSMLSACVETNPSILFVKVLEKDGYTTPTVNNSCRVEATLKSGDGNLRHVNLQSKSNFSRSLLEPEMVKIGHMMGYYNTFSEESKENSITMTLILPSLKVKSYRGSKEMLSKRQEASSISVSWSDDNESLETSYSKDSSFSLVEVKGREHDFIWGNLSGTINSEASNSSTVVDGKFVCSDSISYIY